MTWPASDVVRTNADATGDSPAAFRSDVLDLIDKFNLLRNHVSAFVQGLLDDASAAAARTTLLAAASGANGDITSLSALTGGTPLPVALMPLGVGQTWQDMTASRLVGVSYTNTTGRPIVVLAMVTFTSFGNLQAAVAGVVQWSTYVAAGTQTHTALAVVPNGATYMVLGGASLFKFWELRA